MNISLAIFVFGYLYSRCHIILVWGWGGLTSFKNLFERQRARRETNADRKRGIPEFLLFHPPDAYNRRSWARLHQEPRTHCRSPAWVTGTQGLAQSQVLPWYTLVGSWSWKQSWDSNPCPALLDMSFQATSSLLWPNTCPQHNSLIHRNSVVLIPFV